jgi:hypothetical protein
MVDDIHDVCYTHLAKTPCNIANMQYVFPAATGVLLDVVMKLQLDVDFFVSAGLKVLAPISRLVKAAN